MVAAAGWARRIHPGRISPQQRVHLAALLIAFAALPLCAADDISFSPAITQEEFQKFSRIVAQGIYASPVQPARVTGLLGFDVGVAVTAVKVDTNATYWQRAVGNDFSTSGYLAVPRIVASKGFGSGTISGSYSKVQNSSIKTYGGSLDMPIVRGTIATPELALRAVYAKLSGVDQLKLKTYGAELFLSKGFGPLMPYAAVGKMRSDAHGTVDVQTLDPHLVPIILKDKSDVNRYTVGLRISMFIPKIVFEATQAEVRSYSAKVSVGF